MFEKEVENADMWSFVRTDCAGNTRATNFHAENWFSALAEFVNFLQGNGFFMDKNSIAINEDKHRAHEEWRGAYFSQQNVDSEPIETDWSKILQSGNFGGSN